MAEGWKQVWQDMRAAFRGEAPRAPATLPSEQTAEENRGQEAPGSGAAEASPFTGSQTSEGPPIATVPPPIAPEDAVERRAEPAAGPVPDGDDEGLWLPEAEGRPSEGSPGIEGATDGVPSQRAQSRLSARAVGIAVLLVLAGAWVARGNLQALLSRMNLPAPDVIATFDGGQITIADVEAHLNLLVPETVLEVAHAPEVLASVVEDMILDELVRRWAAEREPEQDESFSHTMQHITEELTLESLDEQRHTGDIRVTESEIRDYYEANRAQFGEQTLDEVRAQIEQTLIAEREQDYVADYLTRLRDNASITRNFELLDVPAPSEEELQRYYEVNREAFNLPRMARVDELQIPVMGPPEAARRQADDALLRLRSGATFTEVTQAMTTTLLLTDTLVPEGSREEAWESVVFALTQGETSDVFQAGEAFSIVRLIEMQPARTQRLEEVRDTVLSAVEQQKTTEWFTSNASRTLFTLKGKQYTVGQFFQEYQELPPEVQAQFAGSDGLRELAELLVERLLLVEDSYDQMLDTQNQPLIDEARLQALKQMMHQEEVDDQIEVSDAEVEAFYAENTELLTPPPRARIRYIRIGLGASEEETLRARQRADEAYQRVAPGFFRQGEPFATIAQEYSEDPETAANGGEYPEWIGESDDFLLEEQLHPFHERVLALNPDEISPPFLFGDSLYIVQVIEREAQPPLTLDEASPYIRELLTAQRHDEQMAQLQDRLFEQAGVVLYESTLLEYFYRLPTPTPGPP